MAEHLTEGQYKAYKKIRGDWGGINPITRIMPDKKKSPKPIKHKKKFYNDALDGIDDDRA